MMHPSTITPNSQTDSSNLTHLHLWDFAGIDGLQLAKKLDSAADRLAPFQSLETTIEQQPCSLLRLCEGNFRLHLQGGGVQNHVAAHLEAQQDGLRVWVKQCEWMSAIALPEAWGLSYLPKLAVPKPPHRLVGLLLNRAVPARIDGISALIWRHVINEQPLFELHTPTKHKATIQAILDGMQDSLSRTGS